MRCLILSLSTVLIILSVDVVVRAEIGAECTSDQECDRNSETCVMLPKDGSQELPESGKCMFKMREYEFCLMDSNCVNGLKCTKHPLIETPLPIVGLCTMCTSDADCGGSEYCDHPVMNIGCIETIGYFDMIQKKKKKAEMMKMMFMKKMMKEKMREMDDDDEDGPPGPPGGPGGRNPRFPNFPVMRNNRRQKRGVGHWALNFPTLRCLPQKTRNSPCKRSSECDTGTCSMEGSCQ